jgi:hypothetical protein
VNCAGCGEPINDRHLVCDGPEIWHGPECAAVWANGQENEQQDDRFDQFGQNRVQR